MGCTRGCQPIHSSISIVPYSSLEGNIGYNFIYTKGFLWRANPGRPGGKISDPQSKNDCGPAFYLSEQITVASCTGQSQCQDIFFDFVNQQPIRQDMAFPESDIISRQGMISIFNRQYLFFNQDFKNILEKLWFMSWTLDSPFYNLF